MVLLVACPRCRRQHDAGGRPPGSVLTCSCGGAVVVPELRGHDARVIRCSSCGAPRAEEEATCRFCGSEFTVDERDLDTVCPGCMARVSGRSRFCHGCGTPLFPVQAASAGTPHPCPACGAGKTLRSRRLGAEAVAVLECVTCGGLWVDREVFEALLERAREARFDDLGLSRLPPQPVNPAAKTPARVGVPLYRPCPVCATLMNRRNYAAKSGVIVDVCRQHGVWFDLDELDRLLRWVHAGGEKRAELLKAEQARVEQRQAKLFPAAWEDDEPETGWSVGPRGSLLFDALSSLLDRLLPGLFR